MEIVEGVGKFPTKSSMPEGERDIIFSHLAPLVASLIDLGAKVKHTHWNVRGPYFIGMHKLLDKVYEEVEELTDKVAERCGELGFFIPGTLDVSIKHSILPEMKMDSVNIINELRTQFTFMCQFMYLKATQVNEIDQTTGNMLLDADEILSHQMWLIEAHLQ